MKWRPPRPDSLRGQLLAWVVIPLLLLMILNIWVSYLTAQWNADRVTDQTLLAGARVIAEQTVVEQGVIEAVVPPAALEMFDNGYGDSVYYRVVAGDGGPQSRLLAGYPDLVLERPARSFQQMSFRHRAIRAAKLRHEVVGGRDYREITVIVGVTLNAHDAFARRLWLQTALQQGVMLLAVALMASLWVRRGLAPLLRLRDAVMTRGSADLRPFDETALQQELRPLVHALNAYMARVEGQMAAQRRFVANAAHQLQTPLALLSTQAAFAASETDADERQAALDAIRRTTRQTHRLAAQLLMLARAEPGARRPRLEPVHLALVARQALEAAAPGALARGIDLTLETPGETALVLGDEMMLREMIGNLVDNAIRYGRDGGKAVVTVTVDDPWCLVRVEDDGPGIPSDQQEQVFERFYRLGNETEGSGLGLAIVQEIARNAGGSVSLETMAAGSGLSVLIRLPVHRR